MKARSIPYSNRSQAKPRATVSAVIPALLIACTAAGQGILESAAKDLDDVSELISFMSPANYASTIEDTQNEFVGIGIQFYPYRSEYVTIARVIYGSPAAKAGIRAGDRITKVNNVPMRYMSPREIVRRMAGDVGEPVDITVLRPFRSFTDGPELDFTIERAVVHLPSVEEARILPGRVAYIRIGDLLYHTPEEVSGRIKEFLERGVRGVVIDVRWVGGGYVRAARDVCNDLLPRGTLMGYIRAEDSDSIAVHTNAAPLVPQNMPVALLANGSTAGAAELLGAAVAHHQHARVFGQATAGRADIDRETSLLGLGKAGGSDETLYTPAGNPIHGHGVEPNETVPMTPNEENKLRMQLFESHMGDPEMENEQNHGRVSGNAPSETAIEDRPLARAVDWMNQRGAAD